jgi:hypothetical protein
LKTKWLNIPPRSLSYPDKWFFWRTIALATFTRMQIKLTGFKTTVSFLKKFGKKNLAKADTDALKDELKMYRFMIVLSYKFWPVINCLSTSLAFWLMLQRRGIQTDLKFGILKEGEKLRSHAWLEHEGCPLSPDDGPVRKYKTFHKPIL